MSSTFDITLQQGLFSDVDGNPLTYSITLADGSALPSWITVQPQLLRLQGRAPENFNGSIDIKVTASDGSLTASDFFKLTVNPINDAPVLETPLPDKTITTGQAFTIAIPAATFTDPDGDPLQFAAKLANGQPLPSWMRSDGTKITGTAPYAQQGTMDIRFSPATAPYRIRISSASPSSLAMPRRWPTTTAASQCAAVRR